MPISCNTSIIIYKNLHGTTYPSNFLVISFFTTTPWEILLLLAPKSDTINWPWGIPIGSSVVCPLNLIDDPPIRISF